MLEKFIQEAHQTIPVSDLVKSAPIKYLGKWYTERYEYAGTGLACLFKVLSVNQALSI
jgi:mannose-6-phosphate isomerase class I